MSEPWLSRSACARPGRRHSEIRPKCCASSVASARLPSTPTAPSSSVTAPAASAWALKHATQSVLACCIAQAGMQEVLCPSPAGRRSIRGVIDSPGLSEKGSGRQTSVWLVRVVLKAFSAQGTPRSSATGHKAAGRCFGQVARQGIWKYSLLSCICPASVWRVKYEAGMGEDEGSCLAGAAHHARAG